MHISIALVIVIMIWYRGLWRDWRQYHATMLFFGFMQLEYNLIVQQHNYFLWKLIPEIFSSRALLISLYAFIVFPGSALLFLGGLPQNLKKQALHISKWVIAYVLVELVGSATNRIEYFHGWTLLSSFIFDIILFPGLILHYKRPIPAYIAFILATVWGVWKFKIPI